MITEKQAKEILEILIKGNDYAELFIEHSTFLSWNNFNNKRFTPSKHISRGTGIRTWKGKDMTYVSIDSIKYEDIKEKALEIENKNDNSKEIVFNNINKNFKENNLNDLDTKFFKNFLEQLVNDLKEDNQYIDIASSSVSTTIRNVQIFNSKGTFIEKTSIYSDLNYQVVAKKDNDTASARGAIGKGMTLPEILKLFKEDKYQEKFKWTPKLAVKLIDAPRIESGEMNVILPSGFGAVLFHEAVGHPLEATQVAKNSSILGNKKGEKIASDLITLLDDGLIPGEKGTSIYDDEGNKNESRVLIENGILKEYLVDEFNGTIYMNREANGAGRRQNYRFSPTSRMSNTFIKKGTSKVEDIIKNTKYGFYAKQLGGGQVDPFTGNFNFGVSEGYLIENGKIKHLVKNATLIGNGIEALKYIDMVADDFEIAPGVCGSASGMIPVTVGQPTLRITKMTVGGK